MLVQRAINAWRLTLALVLGYRGESVTLRAGNLTFITITSLVPFAAVILALVQALDSRQLEQLVVKFFTEVLSPGEGVGTESHSNIRQFLSATHAATGSGFFVVLLISSGILLRHLDASLNEIWAVRRPRKLLTSIGLYIGVLFIGPLLLVLALLGTDWAKHFITWTHFPFSGVVFAVGGVLVAMAVFSALYKLAPHAHVPWRSAMFGGGLAGFTWELARHLYGGIASTFYSASPLYGALGVAPLFLMWIYVSWFIVLSGARLSYAFEHADFHDEFKDLLAHPRSAELIATRIAMLIARSQLEGTAPPTVKGLAQQLKIPAQRVADLAFQLESAGLLARRRDELHAAHDLGQMSVADISGAVGGTALTVKRERVSRTGVFEGVASLFTSIDEASVEKLKGISWKDLAAHDVESQKP